MSSERIIRLPGDKGSYSVAVCKPYGLIRQHFNIDSILAAAVAGSYTIIFRVSCENDPMITPTLALRDDTAGEEYFACCWIMMDDVLYIATAGQTGNIRVQSILPDESKSMTWHGHGGTVNELRVHPDGVDLFLSASEDRSIRLWSISRGGCVAVFGGPSGHRDQVLTVDWHKNCRKFVSGGVDNRVMIWEVPHNIPSNGYSHWFASNSGGPMRVLSPIWASSPILRLHTSYIDCVRWVDERILSKSMDSAIVLWKPIYEITAKYARRHKVYQRLKYSSGSIWPTKFEVFGRHKIIWSNHEGKVFQYSAANSQSFPLKKIKEYPHPVETSGLPIRCIAPISLNENGLHMFLSVGHDGVLRLWI